jgi:cytochrome oxidase assembly protein ShyY1
VFRAVLWTLRQRRYAMLALLMLVIALICIGAGSFEVHRFQEKRHDNGKLKANAHAPTVPLTTSLVPLAGQGPAPGSAAIRYRTVTATGTYLPHAEQYVGNQTQGGRQGFYVLTPLRTASGTLLVVRGFVAATARETRPAHIAAPPAGTVRIAGRLQTAQTGRDQQGRLGHDEITSINPGEQAARLGTPVFQAYVTLTAGQPGTAGLRAVPEPQLSNPTGGAGELQLFSYVLQWYVFALLALIAPFLFSRSEIRDARRRFLGIDPDAAELGLEEPRTALPLDAAPAAGALAVREGGSLAKRGEPTSQEWERAARLADRYGRSLGVDAPVPPPGAAEQRPPARRRRIQGVPDVVREAPAPASSAAVPHRSVDTYHGSYNDYLWQLALADGADVPEVVERPDPRPPRIVEVPEAPASGRGEPPDGDPPA